MKRLKFLLPCRMEAIMDYIIEILRKFNAERNWEESHTPENLAKSISIEAAELLECFQWDNRYDLEALSDEIADVMLYCLMLSDKIGIDVETVLLKKIEKNRIKYPVETPSHLKTVNVAAAIIKRDGKIFVTQRGGEPFKGLWEFPGGKIEKGETPKEALVREITEELELSVKVEDLAQVVEYDYPDFHLTMYCFWCRIESGEPVLKEHQAAKWLEPKELNTVKWLPADIELIETLASL